MLSAKSATRRMFLPARKSFAPFLKITAIKPLYAADEVLFNFISFDAVTMSVFLKKFGSASVSIQFITSRKSFVERVRLPSR